MTATVTQSRFLNDALRWLRAEPAALACAPQQRGLVEQYLAAADRRLRPARALASEPAPVVAAALLRDAVALLVLAVSAARGDDLAADDATAALGRLRARSGCDASSDAAWRVDAALARRGPLAFDAMGEAELESTVDALFRESEWLKAQINLRSPAYWRATRVCRQIGLGILVVWLGCTAVGWIFPRRNLALGKPVRASTQQPGAPDPSGLVDGKLADTYGFHTRVGASDPPWALIDLQEPTDIRKVVVYNRSDQKLDDGLPLALDLSDDGETFRQVAQCTTHFGDGSIFSPPWSVSLRQRARYVRIRGRGYLALNEVEVF